MRSAPHQRFRTEHFLDMLFIIEHIEFQMTNREVLHDWGIWTSVAESAICPLHGVAFAQVAVLLLPVWLFLSVPKWPCCLSCSPVVFCQKMDAYAQMAVAYARVAVAYGRVAVANALVAVAYARMVVAFARIAVARARVAVA